MVRAPRIPAWSGLWRHRDFLLLWGGQSVSELGSAVTTLALPLTAVVVLHASTFGVGLLTAATTAAFLVVARPAGAVVDRLRKRRLMACCDLARLVVVGSVPVAAAAGVLTMAHLYAVALLVGTATVFFDVAYQSYVPSLISREHLMDGNGKLQTTAQAARLAGPGLGGGLVALAGAARGHDRRRGLLRGVGGVAAAHPVAGGTAAAGRPLWSAPAAGRGHRGPEVRAVRTHPAQDRRLHRDGQPVREHGRGPGIRVPGPGAARPARRHRPGRRRGRAGRARRRGAGRGRRYPAHALPGGRRRLGGRAVGVLFSPLRRLRDVPPPGTCQARRPAGGPSPRPAPAPEG